MPEYEIENEKTDRLKKRKNDITGGFILWNFSYLQKVSRWQDVLLVQDVL